MRDDGTNVEDLLAKYLVPKDKPSSTKIGLAIEIVDGVASVSDERAGLAWQVQKLSVNFGMVASGRIDFRRRDHRCERHARRCEQTPSGRPNGCDGQSG